MTLAGLIAETAGVLAQVRSMFGEAPLDGAWTTTGQLATGREHVAGAGAIATDWHGMGGQDYRAVNNGQGVALDSVIGADNTTGPVLTAAGQAAASGRESADALIRQTQADVAAAAPADTPASQAALAEKLRGRLKHARALLCAYERRGDELTQLLERGGAGYRRGAGGMGGSMAGGTGGGMLGIGDGSPMAALTSLGSSLGRMGHHHGHHGASILGHNGAARAPHISPASLAGMPDGRGLMGFGAAQGNPTVGPPDENKIRQWVQTHFGIPNTFGTGSWENASHDYDGGWHHPGGSKYGYAFDFHGTPEQMDNLANWVADHWCPQTLELIHDSPGFDPSRLIKNGAFNDCYGHGPGSTLAAHADHVHWAMTIAPYDLSPGGTVFSV
jgi:hypothetical protein